MSLLVPILAIGAGYVLIKVLGARSDQAAEQALEGASADPDLHDDSRTCPNDYTRWICAADVLTDKCKWDMWDPTIVQSGETGDGLVRTDLCSRHGRHPTGLLYG